MLCYVCYVLGEGGTPAHKVVRMLVRMFSLPPNRYHRTKTYQENHCAKQMWQQQKLPLRELVYPNLLRSNP